MHLNVIWVPCQPCTRFSVLAVMFLFQVYQRLSAQFLPTLLPLLLEAVALPVEPEPEPERITDLDEPERRKPGRPRKAG